MARRRGGILAVTDRGAQIVPAQKGRDRGRYIVRRGDALHGAAAALDHAGEQISRAAAGEIARAGTTPLGCPDKARLHGKAARRLGAGNPERRGGSWPKCVSRPSSRRTAVRRRGARSAGAPLRLEGRALGTWKIAVAGPAAGKRQPCEASARAPGQRQQARRDGGGGA